MKTILVTGRCNKHAGYSLLELLVVLTIIGTMTTIAALSFGGINADPAEEALGKLRFSVELASNESIIRSEVLGLTLSEAGYVFSRLEAPDEDEQNSDANSRLFNNGEDEPRWVKIEKDRLLKPYLLSDGLKVEAYQQTGKLSLPANADSLEIPQIIFQPTGEVTPFEYHVTYQDASPFITRFDALGRAIKDDDVKTESNTF